jgi:hypothetical protein
VSPRAVLDAVVKREIHRHRWESKPRAPIVQSVAQRYTTELSRFYYTYIYVINEGPRINYNFIVNPRAEIAESV